MAIFAGKSVNFEFVTLPTQTTSEHSSISQYSTGITVLAKVDKDVDIMAQMQDAFHHFVDSGQVWALLIGLVLGYIFRSFTSY